MRDFPLPMTLPQLRAKLLSDRRQIVVETKKPRPSRRSRAKKRKAQAAGRKGNPGRLSEV
jgi:hypothetical protein